MDKKEIVNPSIRLPKELKEVANKRAKERGLVGLQGNPNFSEYIRQLIKEDVRAGGD